MEYNLGDTVFVEDWSGVEVECIIIAKGHKQTFFEDRFYIRSKQSHMQNIMLTSQQYISYLDCFTKERWEVSDDFVSNRLMFTSNLRYRIWESKQFIRKNINDFEYL